MEKVDAVIIGAGVVGLAVAAELAGKAGLDSIILMEKNAKFGQETSSRNSEVIHAGIYYPTGSLKALLSVEGKELLYRFCEKWQIRHRRTGKLIVAINDSDIDSLHILLRQASANGVNDLQLLERRELQALEPEVEAVAAILSPSTGVIDSHQFMGRLEQLALQGGVLAAYCHQVVEIEQIPSGYLITFINPDGSRDSVCCEWLVNCAGLTADAVAAMAGIDLQAAGYRIYPCKGEYFSVTPAKAKKVSRLIYPPPLHELKGLGTHVTKTLDGRLKLGPNAIYVDNPDYTVDPEHAGQFFEDVKGFLPFLDISDLAPEMAGIRPKLQGPGDSFRDFVVCHEVERGLRGLINLVGIESPGLTASLSLARTVAGLIE